MSLHDHHGHANFDVAFVMASLSSTCSFTQFFLSPLLSGGSGCLWQGTCACSPTANISIAFFTSLLVVLFHFTTRQEQSIAELPSKLQRRLASRDAAFLIATDTLGQLATISWPGAFRISNLYSSLGDLSKSVTHTHSQLPRLPFIAMAGPSSSPIHAFRINTDFMDKSAQPNITYRKGMQGQLLGFSAKGHAHIFIQGITEGDGFTNRYVPAKFVDKGKEWSADISDWKLQMHLSTTTFNSQNWGLRSSPDTTVLGKTITHLLTAMQLSPPNFAAQKLIDYLGTANVTSVCQTIIQGIKNAGLYNALSRADGKFSAGDLMAAARYRITDTSSSGQAEVYAKFHQTSPEVKHWEPNSSYCYVGKANDMESQFSSHKSTASAYHELIQNSSRLRMIALCILPATANDGLFYLTEQIFICLLQTYQSFLLTDHPDLEHLQFVQPARYLTDMSNEVFRMTGWRGGVRRASFRIDNGANCSSPLLEYASRSDRFLFIRTDCLIKDGKTGSTVPMAFYRRSNDAVANASESIHTTVWSKRWGAKAEEKKLRFSFSQTSTKPGFEVPPKGVPHQLVVEVRKDGTPHPHAWARLPGIGRFRNWDQANSFAIRIEWEDAPGSGKYNFSYCQAKRLYKRADNNIPGSLITYAKAIAFLQFITGARPNHTHRWIPKLAGSARVLETDYNFMEQTITFRQPTEQIQMLSGNVRPNSEIVAQMKQPKYALQNVDGAFGVFSGPNENNRRHCDTCTLLQEQIKIPGVFADTTCVQTGNGRVCTVCMHLGRPCCSWTTSLESDEAQAGEGSVEQAQHTATAVSALAKLPLMPAPLEHQGFTMKMHALQSSERLWDDGDECEEEDEDATAHSDDDDMYD
ncbi:hypothetical protein OPT61_g1993 [Boeremia exigua]|uniref:Uncharacterized protein n=1 Tax=Boeremia exigua TaxID=749465 RepID=A0ACC2IND4_9PLEO|nr:hypothetical protein OPT61_g1993 [Boeremia exigua]